MIWRGRERERGGVCVYVGLHAHTHLFLLDTHCRARSVDVDTIIESIFSTTGDARLPQPVPLSQMIDLLVDFWEVGGVDGREMERRVFSAWHVWLTQPHNTHRRTGFMTERQSSRANKKVKGGQGVKAGTNREQIWGRDGAGTTTDIVKRKCTYRAIKSRASMHFCLVDSFCCFALGSDIHTNIHPPTHARAHAYEPLTHPLIHGQYFLPPSFVPSLVSLFFHVTFGWLCRPSF